MQEDREGVLERVLRRLVLRLREEKILSSRQCCDDQRREGIADFQTMPSEGATSERIWLRR